MAQFFLRYLTYLAVSVLLFALCIVPLIWFAWTDVAPPDYKGSGGSIAILFLGALAILAYLIGLLSYPFVARGQDRMMGLLSHLLSFLNKKGSAAAALPWLLACLHFVLVPLLTILPLIASAESGRQLLIVALTLVVFVGSGVVHRGALLLALRLFPEAPEPARDPKEELLRSVLPPFVERLADRQKRDTHS